MSAPTISYKNHRFPPQIIAHAVWLYFRFPLSLRLAEEMPLERGIVVFYEPIRRWGRKFSAAYAKRLRRKRPSGKDTWHLEEVVVNDRRSKALALASRRPRSICSRRNRTGSSRHQGCQTIVGQTAEEARLGAKEDDHRVTALIRAAKPDVMPAVEHGSHKGLNNCDAYHLVQGHQW